MVEINVADLLKNLENCVRQSEADPYLPVMLKKVKLILHEIKKSKSIGDANYYFDILQNIHVF
ncbi:MAG TPA: hypothetical protein VJJ81_03650 [Candidatus Babeliales bacterium]|nr:hypothetical protein [Candidatus Babeliales bacterium]